MRARAASGASVAAAGCAVHRQIGKKPRQPSVVRIGQHVGQPPARRQEYLTAQCVPLRRPHTASQRCTPAQCRPHRIQRRIDYLARSGRKMRPRACSCQTWSQPSDLPGRCRSHASRPLRTHEKVHLRGACAYGMTSFGLNVLPISFSMLKPPAPERLLPLRPFRAQRALKSAPESAERSGASWDVASAEGCCSSVNAGMLLVPFATAI